MCQWALTIIILCVLYRKMIHKNAHVARNMWVFYDSRWKRANKRLPDSTAWSYTSLQARWCRDEDKGMQEVRGERAELLVEMKGLWLLYTHGNGSYSCVWVGLHRSEGLWDVKQCRGHRYADIANVRQFSQGKQRQLNICVFRWMKTKQPPASGDTTPIHPLTWIVVAISSPCSDNIIIFLSCWRQALLAEM